MTPEVNLKVTPAGAELIVRALRATTPLPDANVDAFVAELWAQYQTQAKAALEAQQAAAATTPSDGSENAPSATAEPIPATANTQE